MQIVDLKEKLEKWKKAAEQGDAEAQYTMGVLYKNGMVKYRGYCREIPWNNEAQK